MATKRVIVTFGNSNTMGYGQLSDVSSTDFSRWTGTSLPTTYPIDISIPGIKCWTPKIPYGVRDTRNITGSDGTHVTFDGAVLTAAQIGQWLYIKTASIGQGQMAKITAGTGTNTATVAAWTAPSTTDSTVEFWTDSHTLTGTPTTTALTKTAATASVAGLAGKWLVVLSGAAVGQASRIASVSAPDDIVLEDALTVAPASGDGICILSGSGSVDAISSYVTANASFRDMRFYYDQSYTYGTGLDYPNWRSPPVIGPALLNLGGATVNYLPELAWQIRNYYAEELYCIHIAVGSSRLSPYLGTVGLSSFSWFDKDLHNDWHPSSGDDLYSVLESTLTMAMDQIVADGDTPDLVGFFTTLAELETTDPVRAGKVMQNAKLLRDSLRQLASDNGWSLKDGSKIQFVFAGVGPSATWTESSTANDALEQLALDDPNTAFIDTSEYTFISDGVHYDADAHILLGQEMFDAWQAGLTKESDAAQPIDTLLSLSAIRTAVRRRYERNGSGNDDTNTQIDQFVNDSLREIYNTLGTNAWFLRRVEQLTMETAYPGTMTLPYPVKQILRIENVNYPGRYVEHKGISYTDSGRIQIALHDWSGGPYYCHFMTMPQDLAEDADRAMIPPHHVELVVMLSCKRLAEAAGNISVATYFASESQRLWSVLKKDALRMDRFRNESLTTLPAYDTWANGAVGMGWI